MDSKMIIFASMIAAMVLLSGCTQGGGAGSGAGLVIDEFTVSPKEIYDDNDYVDVDIVLRNAGSKDMPEDSKLWLYGSSLTNTWQPRGEMVDAMSTTGLTVKTKGLIPGETVSLHGTIDYIGDVPQGVEKEYTFNLRVCYPYLTTYVTNIILVNRDEARIQKPQGKVYEIQSSGPIGIDFSRKDHVVTGRPVEGSIQVSGSTQVGEHTTITINVNYETDNQGNRVRVVYVPFTVSNRGGGIVSLPARCSAGPVLDTQEMDQVAVHIKMDGQDVTAMCAPQDTIITTTLNIGGNTQTADVAVIKLRDGKGRFTCRFTNLNFDMPEVTHDLEVTAFYDYYLTDTQSVKVKSVEDVY